MAQYEDFAYIYDRLMRVDVNYDKWCDYIENLFDLHGVNPDSLCELACGTGNMTSRLRARGYEVCGVDVSEDMLRAAADKMGIEGLICSDMSHLSLKKTYDAFLCMIDGINYCITPKSVLNTFKSVRKYLKDDGVFVFDISSRYKLENVIGNETFIHSEYDVFYSWENTYIEKYNISDMLLNFFVRCGDKYERFEERHIQRGWSEREIKIMLKKAGFGSVDVYDELTFDAPRRDSQRLVFVSKI